MKYIDLDEILTRLQVSPMRVLLSEFQRGRCALGIMFSSFTESNEDSTDSWFLDYRKLAIGELSLRVMAMHIDPPRGFPLELRTWHQVGFFKRLKMCAEQDPNNYVAAIAYRHLLAPIDMFLSDLGLLNPAVSSYLSTWQRSLDASRIASQFAEMLCCDAEFKEVVCGTLTMDWQPISKQIQVILTSDQSKHKTET